MRKIKSRAQRINLLPFDNTPRDPLDYCQRNDLQLKIGLFRIPNLDDLGRLPILPDAWLRFYVDKRKHYEKLFFRYLHWCKLESKLSHVNISELNNVPNAVRLKALGDLIACAKAACTQITEIISRASTSCVFSISFQDILKVAYAFESLGLAETTYRCIRNEPLLKNGYRTVVGQVLGKKERDKNDKKERETKRALQEKWVGEIDKIIARGVIKSVSGAARHVHKLYKAEGCDEPDSLRRLYYKFKKT